MRIIFDIEGQAQVTASLHPYSSPIDKKPAWNGARCELLMVDCIDWNKDSRREGDAIHIEGSVDTIRKMLVDALQMIDFNLKVHQERHAEICDRSMLCPTCDKWADPMSEWHGDGKGHACYGLQHERVRLVTDRLRATENV
jgi:hypothetical protein